MKENNRKRSHNPLLLSQILSPVYFLSGAYLGYCNATGLPVDPAVDIAIKTGSAAVGGTLGAIVGGIMGAAGGGVLGVKKDKHLESIVRSAMVGGCVGAATLGTVSAVISELEMAAGYVCGYIAGRAFQ